MQILSHLYNKKVYSKPRMKTVGWIRAYVFIDLPNDSKKAKEQIIKHEEVGYLLKRPDLLWMFHRPQGFVWKSDLKIDENKVCTIQNKRCMYSANQKIPSTNIRWIDASIVYLKSQKTEAAKRLAKKSPEMIKQGSKVAAYVATDNIQAHSKSLKNMFSEFKKEYKKGREE